VPPIRAQRGREACCHPKHYVHLPGCARRQRQGGQRPEEGGDATSFRVSTTEMAGRATKQEGAAGVRRQERRAEHARGEEIVVNGGMGAGAQIHGQGHPVSWRQRRPVVSAPKRLATRRSGLGLGGNNHEQDLWRWRTSGAYAWDGLETVKAIQTRTPEPDGSSYTPTQWRSQN
jgi:hypothetical protein